MLDIKNITDKFDEKTNLNNLYILDYYPYQVCNNKKYSQTECNYQKRFQNIFFKKCIFSKDDMYKILMFMWLYSDVDIFVFKPDKFGIRHKIKNNITFDNFKSITSEKTLRTIFKFLIKEYTDAYIIFQKLFNLDDVYMYINGISVLFYINNDELKSKLEIIISHCGLFLRKYV